MASLQFGTVIEMWGGTVPSHWRGVWAGCCAPPQNLFLILFKIGHFVEKFCVQARGGRIAQRPPPNTPLDVTNAVATKPSHHLLPKVSF